MHRLVQGAITCECVCLKIYLQLQLSGLLRRISSLHVFTAAQLAVPALSHALLQHIQSSPVSQRPFSSMCTRIHCPDSWDSERQIRRCLRTKDQLNSHNATGEHKGTAVMQGRTCMLVEGMPCACKPHSLSHCESPLVGCAHGNCSAPLACAHVHSHGRLSSGLVHSHTPVHPMPSLFCALSTPIFPLSCVVVHPSCKVLHASVVCRRT